MVKNFKKNAARFISLAVAVLMILSLLPISACVFAATTNHPNAVTVTVLDENGDPVTATTVAYSVHLVNADTDIIDVTDDAVDADGVVEVMSKDDFDAYIAADPTETFILNASAVADGFESALPSSVISDQPITSGLDDFIITLSEKISTETVISDVVENHSYDTTEKTLLNVSVKAGDVINISVNGSYEKDEGDNDYNDYTVTVDTTIPIKRTNAGDYTIDVKIKRDKFAQFVYSKTINIGKYADSQPITLDLDGENPYIYNVNETISCQSKDYIAKENDDDNVDITYSIVEDAEKTDKIEDAFIATIVEGNKIKYTHPGKITVRATIAERPNYNQSYDEKTITVKYTDFTDEVSVTPVNNFYLDTANDILWADGNGVLLSCDGWTIFDGTNWKDSITIAAEDSNLSYSVVLKENSTGNITGPVDIRKFAIDNTYPALQVTDKDNSQFGIEFRAVNNNIFSKTFHALTFGLFFKEQIKATVNCDDTGAGVDTIRLFTKESGSTDWSEILCDSGSENVFTVPLGFKGTVKVTITDKVNNSLSDVQITTVNSNMEDADGYVMLEKNAPLVSDLTVVTPDEVTVYNDIYSGDVKVKFDAQDTESGLYQVKLALFDGDINKYVSDYLAENENATVSDALAAIEDTKLVSIPVNVDEETNKTDTPIQYDSKDTYEHSYSTTTEQTDKVKHLEDGSYNYVALVFDNAGNVTGKYLRIEKDLTAPEISGFNFAPTDYLEGEKSGNLFEATNKAVELTNYGFYFKEEVTVTVYATDVNDNEKSDAISGVKSITWYTEDINDGKSVPKTDDIISDENGEYITFKIEKDFKGQIYAYATDNVGNTDGEDGYVHPNGSVLETSEKHYNTSVIEITPAPSEDTVVSTQNTAYDYAYNGVAQADKKMAYDNSQKVPLYNKNIDFNLVVSDTYSGIRTIKITVFEAGSGKTNELDGYSETVTVDNTKDTENRYKKGEGINGWNVDDTDKNLVTRMSKTITIDSDFNNMVLLVELTDRAGNTSYDYYVFGIDKTAPVIDVNYSNNTADSGKYFKADRTATVRITERNFAPERVVFIITKNKVAIALDGVKWTTKSNEQNAYEPTHEATIDFTTDGDYTFSVSCTDLADNQNNGVNFEDSVAPQDFVIDKTIPTVTVAYDNNDAQNGNYYKADRIATITIDEHNFDANRVKIIGTASETTFPTLSEWKTTGNIHVATLAYTADSLYTFDIEFIDMAGNSIDDFAVQEFTVDKTNPVLEISGIVDKSANSGQGDIGFVITATDTNFDVFEPVITAVRYTEGNFETSKINPGAMSDIANGRQYTVSNIDTDGIYRITCTVIDKAGNAFSEVILQDANGGKYTEDRSGNDVLLTFSVNRDGSVFYVDGYTEKLLKDFYVQNVTENVEINEINADTIIEKTITVNGKALVEGDDYTVTLDKGEGTWHRYTYSIKKSVFEKEGEYNIVIFTKDRANNQAYSDIKNVTAKFVVDRTAPIVTIAGLKADGRYRTDKQIVTVIPSDDGGLLKSLIVRTVDEDGNVIKELINLNGDALLEAVAAGSITFELGEGLYQNVQIICEDAAGNITGESASGELYENVSVSTNAFLIFWANKVARIASIAGASVLFVGTGTFAALKKKKVF